MTTNSMTSRAVDRRDVLGGLGAFALIGYTGRSLCAEDSRGASALSCVVTPSATEGPYFVDEALQRSDLTLGKNGLPLALQIGVYRVKGTACTPLAGAQVDIWHADSAGVYSAIGREGTAGEKFLRGYQLTDADGAVRFTTIYPGWYPGRTPHIHFKVRSGNFEFTSQWFFDDEVSDAVYTAAPYNQREPRRRRNDSDWIYRDSLLMALERNDATAGYVGTFSIGLQV